MKKEEPKGNAVISLRNEPLVRQIVAAVAAKDRKGKVSTVDEIMKYLKAEGNEPPRTEVIHALKDFAEAGGGRFKTGRRGHPSRMEWQPSAKFLHDAAAGAMDGTPLPAAERPSINGLGGAQIVPSAPAVLTHLFNLRTDFQVSIALPTNLTQQEADRLARFIQSLPIDPH